MKCVRVTDPKKFDEVVCTALRDSSAVFVLFFGREDPSSGVSWCPDCVIADPIVRSALANIKNAILLEVPVDRASNLTSPTNIFRHRKDIMLGRIPTLMRWTLNGPMKLRLVEDECKKQAINTFVAKTDLLLLAEKNSKIKPQ
ncbi:hypothetical protein COEREDRAFT_67918 [Coemansia reversa NRRL 1564]|uniref:Thioredoxin domain-containing protein n=1 Tax=Coemansia reversa (strain ATCC 12441 / NRRL 1564) TaxID=763665 RepID=A0A2G5B1B7_COERN|nr:hypothetical protein COEREDRAFT_67918 [Coemansia reversa NRRL 1564]|eukprot:PIA12784.1 hypothetical protein COEREDRAFT_67918 [Coemansia reversa NRRL 1564]